jgi:hypothetical protein
LFDRSLRQRLGSAAVKAAEAVCRHNPDNEIGRVVEELAQRVRHVRGAKAVAHDLKFTASTE